MTSRTQKRRNTRKRNKMLNSLFHVLLAVSGSIVFLVWAFEFGVEGNRFQVNKERKYGVHYLHVQSDGQFSYCEDNGHWFNLEYLAKENNND